MVRKKNSSSSLKGALIMTDTLVGRVLNDVEKVPLIALHVIRTKHVRNNDWIAQRCGWAPTSSWWEVCDKKIYTTHAQLGTFEVLEKLPKWLHVRHLNRPSGAPMTTTVKGRTYIDW